MDFKRGSEGGILLSITSLIYNLSVCPILSEFRNPHFGQARLTLKDYINLLNLKISWSKLAAFCKVAYKYIYFFIYDFEMSKVKCVIILCVNCFIFYFY
jgi:hypothetical protein